MINTNTEVIVSNTIHYVFELFVPIFPIHSFRAMWVANRCVTLYCIKSCGGNSLKCCVKYL